MGEQLTKLDWLKHGLRTLANDGPGALKVGPMAAKLNVSRGSFYWHFQDIEDFRSELLQHWQGTSTDEIIDALDARPSDPDRLKDLLHQAFGRQPRLDRAVRSWAAHDKDVARIVAAVDDRRIARVAQLLVDAGLDTTRAGHRALFLYWAFLGQAAVADQRHTTLSKDALNDIAHLFGRPD
ncbi:TetR/AcrR family transcriptional regulator [Microvirga sp. HBU67558]|uniref:TetR/AcrR family transcriptional regulator n=1 Tax=Microvirga TaxID=186650 RepID=UPI001B361266|nr:MULTISPECIES: TetR/AcrR family transcriptional regulator [unclassified Microvirga]MBQ0820802.1 TetR/AcrR family transcriptional regulator [Microvirga sp. HBU67558]